MLVILVLFADETLARKSSSGTAGGTAKTSKATTSNVSNNNINSNNDTTATKKTKNDSTSTTTTTPANDTNTSDASSTEAVVTPSPYHAHHNYPQAPVLATNSDNNYYSKNKNPTTDGNNKNKQQEEDSSNNDQNGNDNGMVSSPSFAPVVHPVVTATTAPTVFQYNDDTGNDNNNNNSYDDVSEEGSENETDDTVLDEEESDNTNINNNMDDYSNTDPGAEIVIEGYELEVHVTLANTNMVRSRVLALSANDSVGTLISNRVEELTYIWLEEYTRDQLALSQYYAPLSDMSLTLVSSSNSDSDNNTLIYSYVPVSNFLNFPLPTKTTLGTLANECFNYGTRSEEFEQAVIEAVQNDVNVELESVRVIESSSGMIVEGNGDSDLLTSTGTEYLNNNDNTEEGVSLGLLTGVTIAGSAMLLLSSFLVLRAQRRRRLKREKREGDVYDDNDEPESLCDQLLYGDLFLDDDESCGGNSLVYDARLLPVCQGQPLKCKSSSTADSTARSSSSAASTAHSVTSGTTSAMTQSVTNAHQPSSKLYSQSHSYNENNDLTSSPVLEYSMEQNDTSSAASSNSSNSSDDKSFRRFDNAQSKGMENQQGGLLSRLADEEADSTTNYAKSMGWFTARHMTPRK